MPSDHLLLVFFVPSFVLVDNNDDDNDGGAAVNRRATALKILEGLKIAAVPCAANGVDPSPVHHTAPAAGDLPLPPPSDDNDDNNNDAGNARTVGLLYSQSSLRRIATRRPPPWPPWGAACHALESGIEN